MVRKRRSTRPKAIKRCDLLPSPLNAGKARIVHEIVDRHRAGAPLVGRDQWRLLFETGALDQASKTPDPGGLKAVVGSAARVQMLTRQVVGQIQSWLSNRENEFRDVVEASSLDDRTRHQLHTINLRQAWYTRLPICVFGEDRPIPNDVRRLARRIMKSAMARHRRPSWTGLPVQLDQREATLLPVRRANQGGRVDHWVDITAAGVGKACVPLRGTPPHRARKGPKALTVQISRDRGGELAFGIVTDVTDAFAESRAAYEPRVEALAMDFGLNRLFATDQGDLLGRDFIAGLAARDRTLTAIAAHIQRSGGKPRDSRRYKAHAERTRGFIRTEINRVLNRLVETHAPGELILERLDFRSSRLSRRMNRILSNCGRSVVKAKLQDLADRFGIVAHEVDPAYTSQRCSSCGHVHRSNRDGDRFECRRCGLTLHADVNAARNIRQGRSLTALDEALLRPGDDPTMLRGRRRTLEILRQDFERRHGHKRKCRSGGRGPAADSQRAPLRFAWDEVRRTA